MTIGWTGSGGAFSVLGRYFAAIRNTIGRVNNTDPDTAAFWGASGPSIKCLGTEIGDITAQHAVSQAPWYEGIQGYRASMVAAQGSYISNLRQLAETFLINIIDADNPLPSKTLDLALRELIRQMVANTKTVNRCTVSATATAGGSNVGTATMAVSTTSRFGVPLEYAFAETIVAKATGDRFTGSTRGSEPLTAVGAAKQSDPFSIYWPDGSGSSQTLKVVDPNLGPTTGGNLLTNSNFETWTVTNVPDGWAILVGAAGTDVKKNTSVPYGGSTAALEFVADGATLISIAQPITTLEPATVYAVNFWVKSDDVPLAGVLKYDLVDSTNTVIADDAGTNNSITVNASTLTATYVKFSGFFRTPTSMPANGIVKLRVSTPTAVTTGRSVYFDFGSFVKATQLYVGGPYVALFRGGVDLIMNDLFNIVVSNDRGGVIQSTFERCFKLGDKGIILPSSGAANIADSLVA